MPSGIIVAGWEIDLGNRYHVERHGISVRQLWQVLDNPYRVQLNRQGRVGTHKLTGQDDGGACIVVAMRRAATRGQWRPISAWYC